MTKQFTTDWVTHSEENWKRHLLHLNGTPCQILEIGTYEGRSACWFAENLMSHPDSELISVDPAPQIMNGTPVWYHNLEVSIGVDRLSQQCRRWEVESDYAFNCVLNTFDLIYVDGDHYGGQVVKDGINSWNVLNVGGILVFDDYAWTDAYKPQEQPKPAIDYILSLYKGKYELLEKGWQVILKKTSN